jgi:formylglycine-generating enzyme required for sulfatase activity
LPAESISPTRIASSSASAPAFRPIPFFLTILILAGTLTAGYYFIVQSIIPPPGIIALFSSATPPGDKIAHVPSPVQAIATVPTQVESPPGHSLKPMHPSPIRAGTPFIVEIGEGLKMNLVYIPAGSFLMGSPQGERDRNSNEEPVTHVTFTEGFWMGETEVTQKQFKAVMRGNNPSFINHDMNLPVDSVHFSDAVEFCNRMTNRLLRETFALGDGRQMGLVFQLPTEAQWEYACRAGTSTEFYYGKTIRTFQVNYNGKNVNRNYIKGEYRGITTPVKTFKPNGWGLYDMHGNVWEWCADWYADHLPGGFVIDPKGPTSGTFRVLRGGSWHDGPWSCRSASRKGHLNDDEIVFFGFRCVAVAVPPAQ